MNWDQIIDIESQVLLWGFVALIVTLVLAFLRGLLRGWRYGTYRLIAYLILIVVAFATLGLQASFITDFNIAQFWAGPISIQMNGSTLSIPVTTASETLKNLVAELCQAANLGSPDAITSFAIAFATSLIKWIAILLDGLIISTIGAFLIFLLWHIAFKHIIPKEKRKATYKSGKLASAFEELVVTGLVMTMLLSPFTSLINSVAHHFNPVSPEEEATVNVDAPTYAVIKQAIDTYDNSLMGQVFFGAYARNSQNESFDEQLVNFFTSTPVSEISADAKLSFGSLIGDVTKIASIALEGGLFEEDNMNAVGYLTFASSHYLPDLIDALAESSFITTLLPIGVEYALSLDQIKTFIGTEEGVDTSHVNWADALGNLSDMVIDIQQAGVLSMFDSSDPNDPSKISVNSEGISHLFDADRVEAFNRVLDDLDDNSWVFFNKLLSTALYIQSCKSAQSVYDAVAGGTPRAAGDIQLSDFLPAIDCTRDGVSNNPAWDSDGDGIPDALPTAYSEITFGQEIKSVYNAIADLNTNLADVGVENFVPNIMSRAIAGTVLTDNYMTDLLFDHPRVIEASIIGDTDGSGNIINFDPLTGKSTGTACLLDNTFLNAAMPRLLSVLSDTVSTSLSVTIDGLPETIAAIDTRLEFKNEFNTMFKIVNALVAPVNDDNGIGKNFIKHIDQKPGLNFNPDGGFNSIDDGLLTDLQNAMTAIDSSPLLCKIMKAAFNNFLGDSITSIMGAGWLAPSFPESGLGSALADLLGVFGDCGGIIRYVSGLSSSGSLTGASLDRVLAPLADGNTGYQAQLAELLRFAATSPLLNPETTVGGSVVKNTNFLILVNKALGVMGDEYIITQADLADPSFDAATEADAFANTIVTLISSGLISTLSNYTGATLSINALKGVDFKAMLKAVGDSVIMSKVFVRVLDSKVLPIIKSLSSPDLADVSFGNITDWEQEGECLNSLVRFASEIGDFANIKYLESDPACISGILRTLSESQMFVKKVYDGDTYVGEEYLFPKFFQDKFIGSLGLGGTAGYFNDIGTDGSGSNPYTYNAILADFETVAWLKDGVTGEYTYYDLAHTLHRFDTSAWSTECDIFEEIVRRAEYIGGIDSFQAGNNVTGINPTDFDALFQAVSGSVAFGRVLTYHLFEQSITALVSAGSTFRGANLAYLWTCSPAQRLYEIQCMTGLLYVVLDAKYGLVGTGGSLAAGNIEIDGVSPDYCLKPMLTQIAVSSVFNSMPDRLDSIPDVAFYTGQSMTACEYQMFDLLQKGGFYLDDLSQPDEVLIETQVRAIGHLSGVSESTDGASELAATGALTALLTEIGDGSTQLSVYSSGGVDYDRHAALVALGLSEAGLSGKTPAEARTLFLAATTCSVDQASLRTVFINSGSVNYLIDASAIASWKKEAKALSNVGKRFQDFIVGTDKFSITSFDVTKYFLNEFEDEGGGLAYITNPGNIAENDFAQAKITSLLAQFNDSRLLYADLPGKIKLALKIIADSLASFNGGALSALITSLRVDSIATIDALEAGHPEILPYDAHLVADPAGYKEIQGLSDILREGSILMKIDMTASPFATVYQANLFGNLLAAWNTAHS